MPIFANLLVNLFSGLVGWFSRWFSKKIAMAGATVATFAGLTLALYGAIGALLKTVAGTLPDDSWILMGMWVALPDNAQELISITVAADTVIALYRWNRENLRLMAFAN